MNEILMKQALKRIDPTDNPVFDALADIIAGLEAEQSDALQRCIGQCEMEVTIENDPEERKEELLNVADAMVSDDLARFWFEEVVGVDFDAIQPYLGMDAEQWADQKLQWVEKYHELGAVETDPEEATEETIEKVARTHVSERFGMEYEAFVSDVINWQRGRAIETMVAGPIRSYSAVMQDVADELEAKNARIEELEARVQEIEGGE